MRIASLPAGLHRGVDLRVADPRDMHPEVARDREIDEPAAAGIGVEKRERVAVLVDAAALRSLPRRVVGADEEDVRRGVVERPGVGRERGAHLRGTRLFAASTPLATER